MNLLTDKWIPVRDGGTFSQITLQQLLTSEADYQLALPRDDMETGALQMLISLAQVIAIPETPEQLRERATTPLSEVEYLGACENWLDRFDLMHESCPFMQAVNPGTNNITPVQKLFIGLPAGNNHALFNAPGEINEVCCSCAAVALFNLASNAPGFSGKHKAGLRGGGKISTFAAGNNLRETIWLNVLSREAVTQLLPDAEDQEFCWVSAIEQGQEILAGSIGINRGLFWQPLRIRLSVQDKASACHHCGHSTQTVIDGFRCEADFKFDVVGQWPHPHSPVEWSIKDGEKKERYLSFNQLVPGWTHLNQFVLNHASEKEGNARAAVIKQFDDVFLERSHPRLIIYVAGYANKQAAIQERRHELFAMPKEWQDNKQAIEKAVKIALEIKRLLRGQLYYFGKEAGAWVHVLAERQYYQQTEYRIHALLRSFDNRKTRRSARQEFTDRCMATAREIFESHTAPYRHSPQGLKQYAIAKARLNAGMRKIEI